MRFALLLLLPLWAQAETFYRLENSCVLRESLDAQAKPTCEKPAGTPLLLLDAKAGLGYRIRTKGCVGWVEVSCVNLQKAIRLRPRGARERSPSSEMHPAPQWLLGIGGIIDVLWALVPYSTTASTGAGIGGNFSITAPLGNDFRFGIASGVQLLSLGRALDGSGEVTDPTPLTLATSYLFVAAGAGMGYRLWGSEQPVDYFMDGMSAWIEVGGEYGYPLSATQYDSDGNRDAVTATDRYLVGYVGPALQIALGGAWVLQPHVHFLYNFMGISGSRFFGSRITISVEVAL